MMDPSVIFARDFAIRRHAMTRYGDGQPYEVHLAAVEAVIVATPEIEEKWQPFYRCATWLHDTIEDTGTTRGEIEERFGAYVGDLVWACSGFGPNRAARNADIVRKLLLFPAAAPLKCADRIANLEACRPQDRLASMYIVEHPEFAELMNDCGISKYPSLVARLNAAIERLSR